MSLFLTLHVHVSQLISLQPKYEMATRHLISVVTPDWLLDSIELGKKLNVDEYHPNCLRYLKRGGEEEEEEGEEEEEEDVTSLSSSEETSSKHSSSLIVTSGKVQNIRVLSKTRRSGVGRSRRRRRAKRVSTTVSRGKAVEDGLSESEQVTPRSVPVMPDVPTPAQPPQLVEEQGALPKKIVRTHTSDLGDAKPRATDVAEVTNVPKEPVNGQVLTPERPNIECRPTPPDTRPQAPPDPTASRTLPEEPHTEKKQLLRGIVMCLNDYQDCMDTETIATWNEVNLLCVSFLPSSFSGFPVHLGIW